jgi:DNA-binding CsgD family transcriptional regulator
MASSKRDGKRALDGLVPEEVAAGHGLLYASGGIPKDLAEERLGSDLIRELMERGLAHTAPHTPTSPPSFRAVSPDVALLTLLAELQARTAQDHDMIMKCLERLREVLPGPAGGCGEDPRHAATILTDKDEIISKSGDLIHSVNQDWMTLENTDTDMPITEDFAIRIPPLLRATIRCRAIWNQAAVEHPVALKHIEHAVAEGEETRIVQTVPMKMKLADRLVALLPLSPTASGGALLIRGSDVPILHALRDYFELKWATATRFGTGHAPPGCPLTREQLQVLNLMGNGLTDGAISHRLDISESTVSRHVTAILKYLNVPSKSRFVAGAIAHQRGLITDLEGGSE